MGSINERNGVVSGAVALDADGKLGGLMETEKKKRVNTISGLLQSESEVALSRGQELDDVDKMDLYVSTGGNAVLSGQSTVKLLQDADALHTASDSLRSKFAATVIVPSTSRTQAIRPVTDIELRSNLEGRSSDQQPHSSNAPGVIYSASPSQGVNRPNTNLVGRESLSSRNKLAQAIAAKTNKNGSKSS